MYPSTELNRSAALKTALHQRIAAQRRHCVAAAAVVAEPVAWLDRVIAIGRQFAPLAHAALAVLWSTRARIHSRSATSSARDRWLRLLVAAWQVFARWQRARSQ